MDKGRGGERGASTANDPTLGAMGLLYSCTRKVVVVTLSDALARRWPVASEIAEDVSFAGYLIHLSIIVFYNTCFGPQLPEFTLEHHATYRPPTATCRIGVRRAVRCTSDCLFY